MPKGPQDHTSWGLSLFLFWTACSINDGEVKQQQHQQQHHALNTQRMQQHLMPVDINSMTVGETHLPKA